MPRFFKSMSAPAAVGDTVIIDGQDAVHIARSLRLRTGDEVLLCDGRSTEYQTLITAIADKTVQLTVTAVRASETEPSLKITLYQGLPKSDKLEWIIQKTVELGVTEIVPVAMSRCVAKIGDKADKKTARFQAIANEAAGQSGRGILPTVSAPLSFHEALARMKHAPTIVCYEGGGNPFCDMIDKTQTTLNVVIGPEGGIAPDEIEQLQAIGAVPVTLGKRILRCETAPVAVIAAAMALSGNWE